MLYAPCSGDGEEPGDGSARLSGITLFTLKSYPEMRSRARGGLSI